MNDQEITMHEVSARLRSIRRARGWSLLDVERESQGRIKAVVIGSYERGTRTLSVRRAIEIADIYRIPVSSLFTEKSDSSPQGEVRIVLDVRAISRRIELVANQNTPHLIVVAKFIRKIMHDRHDWNGEVISLREGDLAILALMTEIERDELRTVLEEEKALLMKRISIK
jgi:transcriptional regulator with XRE-family HTH domain